MGIVILKNQPIDFTPVSNDPDCGCGKRSFCQIIDPTDATQFQISVTDIISNGDFEGGRINWVDEIPLQITINSIHNESTIGACDGSIDIVANFGTAPYYYSFDGGTFGLAHNKTGICSGCYYVTVKDSSGKQGSLEYCITHNVTCSDYKKTTDFVGVNTLELLNCYTTDFH